ncbi:HAD family phosphatase [Candidatus Woesearchaeota archaeon]|nr:HAD family phosphatase [Candidatus Woesearchaeota archaeon]
MIKAVIFDMDGVIFDTEPIGYEATKKLFKLYNKDLKFKDVIPYFGTGVKNYVGSVAKKYKVNEDMETLMKKRRKYFLQIAKKRLMVFPGVINLIKILKNNKIKIALATASSIRSVKYNFKITKLNIKLFDVVITRNDVKKLKPNPEIFIAAIEKLKVKHNETVVVEDAVSGIIAAKRAKTKVIAIANSSQKNKLKMADLVVNSFKEITLRKLDNL